MNLQNQFYREKCLKCKEPNTPNQIFLIKPRNLNHTDQLIPSLFMTKLSIFKKKHKILTQILKIKKSKLIETKLNKLKQSFQSFKSFDYFKKTNFKKVISKINIVSRQGQGMVKATRTTLTKTTVWWVLTQFKITLVYMTSIIVKICYIVISIS